MKEAQWSNDFGWPMDFWCFRHGGQRTSYGDMPDNRRDPDRLIPMIKKHIAPDNHSINFINAETGANVQAIESQWRPLILRFLRGGIRRSSLDYHFCEYLWRRKSKKKGRHIFVEITRSTRIFYPGVEY